MKKRALTLQGPAVVPGFDVMINIFAIVDNFVSDPKSSMNGFYLEKIRLRINGTILNLQCEKLTAAKWVCVGCRIRVEIFRSKI
jgi:hypothetical protein